MGFFARWICCGVPGVVPVLTGPLQALLVILPVLILALLTAIISLLRPQAMLTGIKLLWRLKFSLAVLAVGCVGVVWAANALWPSPATGPVSPTQRGEDWPMLRGGPARTGAVAGTAEPNRASVNWVYRRDDAAFFSSPAVVGNRVYVSTAQMAVFGGGNGQIVCLAADTGFEVWRAAPKGYRATFSSPVVSGNYLVCGEGLHTTTDARVICLDLTPGRESRALWTHRTRSHVECAPVIHNGCVYVGAGDDGYYCLKLDGDGRGGAKVIWHVPGDRYPDAETSLIVHEDRVYAGLGASERGRALCVLDAKNGKELHRIETGMPIFSPPAIARGKLYVGMGTGDYVNTAEEIGEQPCGALLCFDLQTMQVDWRFSVGRTVLGAPAVSGDHVYFGSRDGYVYCVDTSGQLVERWDARVPIPTSPAVTEHLVYAVTELGRLHCLDRSTFQAVWEYQIGTKPLFISSPAVARGRIYVGTQHDGLVCVGRPGEEEQVSLWPGHLGGAGASGNLDNSPLPKLGDFLWQYPAGESGQTERRVVCAPIAAVGKNLYVPLAGEPASVLRQVDTDESGATGVSPVLELGATGVSPVLKQQHGQHARSTRQFRLDTVPTGIACLPADTSDEQTPSARWVYATENGVTRSPAVCRDTVLAVDGQPGQTHRALHAIDTSTGQLRWESPVTDRASGVLACTEDAVFVQDNKLALTCLDLTGRQLWSQEVGQLHRAPTAAGSLLVVAVVEPPALTVLDGPTGLPLWHTPLSHHPTTSPYVDQERIILGTAGGLQARSLIDGTACEDWEPNGYGVSSALAVDRKTIAFVDNAGLVVVVSRQDGSVLCTHSGAIPGIAPLRSRERIVYASAEGLMVFAPDRPAELPTLWADMSWLGEFTTPPVLSRSNLYAGMVGWGLVRLGASR